jgi:hypothetical protein
MRDKICCIFSSGHSGKIVKKLIAAHANGNIAGANGSLQAAGEFLERHVARGVSILVVNLFKPVEIEREQKQRLARFFRFGDFFLQAGFTEAPIVESS